MDFYNGKSSPCEGLAITGLSTIEEKNKVTIKMLLIQIILIVNTEQIEYSFIISVLNALFHCFQQVSSGALAREARLRSTMGK